MRKNFDMDAAIRRALRESIEAHAHEWEPNPDAKSSEIGDGSPFEKKVSGEMYEGTIPSDAHEWEPDFKTGVGPVGDDAPFDNKVSESCDKEEACCPKCGKCPCECEKEGEMNEGTIPGDSHEWEPDFKTSVGPVGDDNPFTQAVNEAFVEGGDWEKGSFGAPEHKKEGIAFADGGDECQNGVVATGQKNSGEVVSKDNLSEGEDEEGEDEGLLRNIWQGAKAAVKPAVDRFREAYKDGKAQDQAMKDAQAYAGKRDNYEKNAEGKWQLKQQNTTPSAPAAPAAAPAAQNAPSAPAAPATPQDSKGGSENNNAAMIKNQPNTAETSAASTPEEAVQKASPEAKQEVQAVYNQYQKAINGLLGFIKQKNPQLCKDAGKLLKQYGVSYKEAQGWMEESVKTDDDIITEERDRFFDIINRIEKLYD